MLTIRLSRVGKKKQPSYRLIVSEKARDPWGKATEILGHYNPRSNPKTIVLKAERINYWISKGAQTSATVHNLLVDEKIIKDKKIRTLPARKVSAATEAAPAAKAAETPNEASTEPTTEGKK